MGHVIIDGILKGSRAVRVRMFVDTGATHCLISSDLARRSDLPAPKSKVTVRLANGQKARLPLTSAVVKIDGREAGVTVLIANCKEPILGVEALESLGLMVDPKHHRLRSTRPYAARLGGYR